MVRRKQPRQPSPSPPPPSPAAVVAVRAPRWQGALAAGSVLLLLVVLYPEPLLQGRVYSAADTAAADAFRQVGEVARRAGEYPLWNPYIFGGMPSFGSLAYTHGVYPPTLLFEWLQDRGLPPLTWLLGHLFFGGLGMWWLLGRWRVPWAGRLLGVVVWLWSARLVAWAVHGHGSKLGAEMYLPWLAGLTWTVLARGGLRPAALAALLLGLQFLRGHLQISFYALLLMGALTVWHLVWPLQERPVGGAGGRPALPPPHSSRWRRAGLVAVAIVLGFAIGAALLMPVHGYAAISTRGEGGASGGAGPAFDYATAWSLAPEDVAAMFLPAVAGFGKATYMGRMPFTDNPVYIGLLVPFLAAAAWLAPGRRSLVWGLGAIALLALLLAMGRFSPGLYQFFYAVVPYFDKFRVPSMITVLVVLALAALAPLGAAALADRAAPRTRWLRRAAGGLFGAGALLLLLGATGLGQDAHRDFLAQLAARGQKQAAPVLLAAAWDLHAAFLVRSGWLLLAGGGAMLLASRRERFRCVFLVPVLAALVAIDHWGVARLVTHPEKGLYEVVRTADGGGRLAAAAPLVRAAPGPAPVQVDPALAAALATALDGGRLLPLGADAMSNAYMTAGIRSLGGYHPAKPATAEAVRQRLFGRLPAGHLAVWLGAAALTYPDELPPQVQDLLRERGLDLLPDGMAVAGTWIYRLRDPLPRARLVDSYELSGAQATGKDLAAFLDAVAAGQHDFRRTVVLDREPSPRPQTGQEPLPEPVITRDGLNEVALTIATPRPAVLVLADLAAPGWRVAVNGQPATLLRADLALRAVALPAGSHDVRFEFHDPALRRGLLLALGGVLGVAVLLAAAWAGARRRPQPPRNEGEQHGIVS